MDGGIEKAFHAVGCVGRHQYVFHAVEGVAGGERFHGEHVEGCAADFAGLECLNQGGLIDDGAAADVDDDGAGLHGGDLRGSDHAAGFGSQRSREEQVVAGGNELVELWRSETKINQAISRGELRAAAQGGDLHSEGAGALRGCLADASIAYDSQRFSRQHAGDEVLPHARLLLADDAAEIEGEMEHHRRHPIGQGSAEDAAAVREQGGMGQHFRFENAFDAGPQDMDPAEQDRIGFGVKQGVGFRSGLAHPIEIVADDDANFLGGPRESLQKRCRRIGDHQEYGTRHRTD